MPPFELLLVFILREDCKLKFGTFNGIYSGKLGMHTINHVVDIPRIVRFALYTMKNSLINENITLYDLLLYEYDFNVYLMNLSEKQSYKCATLFV